MTLLARFLIVCILGYFGYAGAASLLANRVIYPFSDLPFESAEFRSITVTGPHGPIEAAVAGRDPTAPVVVYFQGNAGSRALFSATLDAHRQAGFRVVAMRYPGAEGGPGVPRESRMKDNALALVTALPGILGEEGEIHLHGYSMGTGLAAHVAARRDVSSVVLQAPFPTLCGLMQAQSYVPACQIPWIDTWTATDDLERIDAPVRVLHGLDDRLTPPRLGRAAAEAILQRNGNLRVKTYPDAGHGAIAAGGVARADINAFLTDGWRTLPVPPDEARLDALFPDGHDEGAR